MQDGRLDRVEPSPVEHTFVDAREARRRTVLADRARPHRDVAIEQSRVMEEATQSGPDIVSQARGDDRRPDSAERELRA